MGLIPPLKAHFPFKNRFRGVIQKKGWKSKRLSYNYLSLALFPDSSAVEHSTVNRMVAGSNPARGATHLFIHRTLRETDVLRPQSARFLACAILVKLRRILISAPECPFLSVPQIPVRPTATRERFVSGTWP